jgi:hypothetical protein
MQEISQRLPQWENIPATPPIHHTFGAASSLLYTDNPRQHASSACLGGFHSPTMDEFGWMDEYLADAR